LGQKQLELPEVNLVVASDVPMGGGLSSSAALEVAVLLAMRELLGERTDSLTLALEAQRAEHDFAGTPCGIMDMYVSAAAQANNACLIDCRDNSLAQVRVPSENDVVFLVTDTQTRHALADGAYAERRQACEAAAQALGECHLAENTIEKINRSSLDDTQRDAALHVVGETNRVRAFAAALADGELATAGTLMFESHESLATLFNVSCAELDLLVDTARGLTDAGVFGARMTGGGFGGSTITLCKPEAAAQVADHYATQFAKTFGTDCISFSTRPAAGARVEFQT
jgi:galactokinase